MQNLGTQNIKIEKAANVDSRSIVFFLVPEFSMIAFATAVEPLRMANRMLGEEYYKWRIASMDGAPVIASNGVEIAAELCTAAFLLAAAGLLKGKRCAIHWENLPGFAENFPDIDVYADLYEMDGNTWTCAGGTAALDMMLSMIEKDLGEDLVNRVCEQALTDRVRNPNDRQRLPLRARLGVQNAKVLSIIEFMEANIAEPLQLVEIADYVGLSRRQIERLFQQHMGRSPARYYLEIRLDRARHLLMP